jgi:adenylate kinase
MAAVQMLFRAAATGGGVTAASMRRMSSLAMEQAPSAAAATGFPFNAEEKLTRRPAAERNVQWVFLGCPGVGKGTYASRLSRLLGVPHIATGDLVRDELASTGPLATQVRAGLVSVIRRLRPQISPTPISLTADLDLVFYRLDQRRPCAFQWGL